MQRHPATAALALLFALAACTQPAGEPSSPDPTAAVDKSADDALPSIVIGEVPGELLEGIVADAAERTGVTPDEVEVTTAESVTWSDGSLGCPEPGMMYTQAQVNGYWIVIEAAGQKIGRAHV